MSPSPSHLSRRAVLERLALGAAGLGAAGLTAGCRDTRLPGDALARGERAVVLFPESLRGPLDPRLNTRAWPGKIIHLMFEGLTSVHNARLAPEPALAARIEQPTPTTYDVWLRPEARFHDGAPVTPADVVATLRSIQAPALQSPLRSSHERLADLTVLGDHRLRLTLREPHAPYLTDLSVGILPARLLGPDGHLLGPPVGAGPYALHHRTDDREVVLARHDAYWQGRPRLPYLVFRAVADQNTRLLALLSGAGDLVQNAVTPRLAEAMRARPELAVDASPGVAYTYLCPNLRLPALGDARVRRALLLALDRQALIQHKFRGVATRTDSMLPAGHWAFNRALPPTPVDREAAAALLDAAGLKPGPDGVRLTVELKVNTDKFRRNLAWLIAADWARVGVATKVRPLEPGTLLADVKSGNFELYLLQWGDPTEPHFYNWIFHSDRIPSPADPNRGGNRGAWRHPEVDRLIDAGRVAPASERAAIYQRIQAIVADELPYLSLWHEDVVVVRQAALRGYQALPDASLFGLWQAHWAPG